MTLMRPKRGPRDECLWDSPVMRRVSLAAWHVYPPKKRTCPLKGTISIGNTSSNHWFSGAMLVLGRVEDCTFQKTLKAAGGFVGKKRF